MLTHTAPTIRTATPDDARALRLLAALDDQRALRGPTLIAQVEGEPLAAISLSDGRVIADPFRPTAAYATALRMRARAVATAERTPSLAARIRAAIHARPQHA